MKTVIGVRLSVEGFHNYPTAIENHGEVVKFLEFPHRHNFGIIAKRRVRHDNRDMEFILFKRAVLTYLYEKYGSNEENDYPVCQFGAMSCEMIAKELVEHFGLESCEVNEDGENFAEVRNEEVVEEVKQKRSSSFTVEWVIGRVCSGKGTYVLRRLERDAKEILVIEIGDIVRQLSSTEGRVFDKRFDDAIIEEVIKEIENIPLCCNKVLIVGCRQLSIFEEVVSFLKNYNFCSLIEMTYLNTIKRIRKERFEKRNATKDSNLSFEEVEKNETNLGLDVFIAKIIRDEEVLILNNFEK